jgi:hypothetical protein
MGREQSWRVAVMLSSAEAVLALQPGFVDLHLGVVGRTHRAPKRPLSCAPSSPETDRPLKIPSPGA